MTLFYMLGKYLLLIPLVALATYLTGTTPVTSQETGYTIGLPYGAWILLFAVTALLAVLFVALLLGTPARQKGRPNATR